MHSLGAHSHLFRGSPAIVAGEFRRHGLTCVQLSPNFPDLSFRQTAEITRDRCRRAVEPFRAAGIAIACLSGPSNLLDPDLDRRHRGIVRCHGLIRHCRDFGTDRIVVETGSLSPASPCVPHPPNRSREAWAELRLIANEALKTAADHGVMLLLKPDSMHVLATAEDARRLCKELGHPNLAFVLDAANLLVDSRPGELTGQLEALCERLGPWAPVIHAKDIRFDAAGTATPRVGRGVLDYGLLFRLMARYQPAAPVILEHVRPEEVGEARAYLSQFLERTG